MSIRNTYWVATLSVILCFSMVLPLCVHAEMNGKVTHDIQNRLQTKHNHASDCKCGHQLAEAFQKVDYQPISRLDMSLVVIFTNDFSLLIDHHLLSEKTNRSVSFDGADPPTYLLNSVFLN